MVKPTTEQLCELHRRIEAGIVTRASLQAFLEQGKPSLKPVPDTSGLRIIKVMVKASDPRWQRIDPKAYAYCNENARTSDFPVHATDREVTVVIFPPNYFANDPSNEDVRAEIERRNLMHPDRAVTETVLDKLKDELAEEPLAGICGVVPSGTNGSSIVGCVLEDAGGRCLDLDGLQSRWRRYYRFAAVVSE